MGRGRGSEKWTASGQVTPLVAMAVLLVGLLLVGLGRMAATAVAAAQARTAADAAALAGAREGPAAARELAVGNGGSVVAFDRGPEWFEVTVRVGNRTARARAHREPPAGGTGERSGLAPAMLAALARADQLTGTTVPVVSGYRSRARQAALWANRESNPYPVAPPGRSRHETGMAIDVPLLFVPRLVAVAADSGLCHPLPESDPVHFVVCQSHQ
ncbi:MAG TPA: hypothetical protein ENI86_13320 [Acidimicrobiales bacterium]|nr:hypothetical protein [Acidimicrobiales bacterium]